MGLFCFSLRRFLRRSLLVSSLATLLLPAIAGRLLAIDLSERGKALFIHPWQPKDSLSGGGDGLGPMFNGRSCAECHNQGALGGGGGLEHNVVLLTVVGISEMSVSENGQPKMDTSRARLILEQIHPDFKRSSTAVIHNFSTSQNYAELRRNMLALKTPANLEFGGGGRFRNLKVRATQEGDEQHVRFGEIVLQRAERNTPSLYGDAAIDKIRAKVLDSIAEKQPDGLKGKRAGRFGWHGQTATLQEFVQGACANELGLEVIKHTQPLDPTRPQYRTTRLDMSTGQVAALAQFVSSLPPPKQYRPEHPDSAEALRRGESLFTTAQCAVCHVPNVDGVNGIYSDLLLHDMEKPLSDPLPMILPGDSTQEKTKSEKFSGYFGSGGVELARQWRTPPLWGVRDSAPYLHDGRAETIQQAIQMHTGQGGASAEAFKKMNESERLALVTFVKSLGAP